MLPRWLPLQRAAQTGEFSPTTRKILNPAKLRYLTGLKNHADAVFQMTVASWNQKRDIIEAQELVAAAVVYNVRNESVQDAARLLLAEADLSASMRSVIAIAIGEKITKKDANTGHMVADTQIKIALHKKRLQLNPHDALSAAEMALFYTYLGQSTQARLALERASISAPDSRYVLRAIARFSAHEGDPEVGLHYLHRSARSDVDPWLLSAKLSLSRHIGQSPTNWRKSKLLANDENFHPRSVSELSAQLATFSADSGSKKQTVRMLDRSVISPTENTLAQLEHIDRKFSLGFSERVIDAQLPASDEATAHRMLSLGQLPLAIDACRAWSELEPFSSSPAIFGSFIASIKETYATDGIALIDNALTSNPFDETLLNNKAVLLSLNDDPQAALKCLEKFSANEEDSGVSYSATTGLIQMRLGNLDEGISHYEQAILTAKAKRQPLVALRAFLYFSREIIRLDPASKNGVLRIISTSFEKLERAKVRPPVDLELLREIVEKIAEQSDTVSGPAAVGTIVNPIDVADLN